jgi:hypothetical protein
MNAEDSMGIEKPDNFDVFCSSCGALFRSSATADSEQVCLICHARMLNDYFQELRRRGDSIQPNSAAPK